MVAVFAAGLLHGVEEFFDAPGGLGGVADGVAEQVGEDVGGQQVFIFGEHAEQALDEEMGDLLAAPAAPAHGGGEFGEVAGGLGSDRGGQLLGTQLFRVGEHPSENLPLLGVDQLLDADFARLVRVAGEGGVDDDALAVADDEQRRVVELQRVVGELLEGGIEVAAGLLVLPAETTAHPDIGPAVAAAGL